MMMHRQEDEVDRDFGDRIVAVDKHGDGEEDAQAELGERVARRDALTAAARPAP
jgi:hypothetical protein